MTVPTPETCSSLPGATLGSDLWISKVASLFRDAGVTPDRVAIEAEQGHRRARSTAIRLEEKYRRAEKKVEELRRAASEAARVETAWYYFRNRARRGTLFPVPRSGGNWAKIRREVIMRDLETCTRCGNRPIPGRIETRLEVDHIIPVSKGGSYLDQSNLVTLCRRCHVRKTTVDNATRPWGQP